MPFLRIRDFQAVFLLVIALVFSPLTSLAVASGGSVYLTSLDYPTTLRNQYDTVPYGQWITGSPPIKDTNTVHKKSSSRSTPPDSPSIDAPVLRRSRPDGADKARGSADTTPVHPSERDKKTVPPASTADDNLRDHSTPAGRRSVNIGIQYPGVSLGFRRPRYSVELKALHDNDITILGARYYHHLWLFDSGNIYWTTDLSTVTFEGEVSSGDGISTGVAGGVEKFFGQGFSWKVDVGPYYTFLDDDDTNFDEDGLEFVITTALSFHFN